ncbi:unnamed protein product [Phytophthora lilii]|uniref:Unnamed protein product n=1 Tax=Phytophthora lilii TaxID=2077276 RepID=A0A9W6TG87_9STRA|nr:unnamed protein product [Phytophthora lilii]
MRSFGVAMVLAPALATVCLADNLDKYGVFTPKKIALGSAPSMDGQSYSGGFTLNADKPLATLDYDYEVAGLPYFMVSSVANGPVEVEIKYAEQFPALSLNYSDGPSQFTTSIANSRRVETHRFTENEVGATITSMLSQPGERWQTLRLLSGDSVTFEKVGLQASVEVIDDLTTLPGKFSSSNSKYDEIWKLGARAVTAACLDAGSQIPSWRSDAENGTFVPGTRPGISYRTWNLTNYVLNFESQIIRGGAGYTIAYDLTGNRDGVQIHLASEYPSDTTYSNVNTTLFPASTATLAYGYDFANATSMTSYILGQYNVPFSVKEPPGVANSKPEQITGTWTFLFEYQDVNGQLAGFVPISYLSSMPTPEAFLYNVGKPNAYYNFPDYVILGLIGLESYMDYFDGVAFVQAHWEEFTHAMTWLVSCQGSNGLIDLSKYVVVFLGSGAGMAVNAAAVQCLNGMARVARAVGDWESADAWIETATSVKAAINELLWNDTLGNYAVDVKTQEVPGLPRHERYK